MVGRNVPVGHPDFGKAFVCPACGGGVDTIARANRALEEQFGEMWMYGSQKLRQFDLDDFLELPEPLKLGKGTAINAVYDWSEGEGRSMLFLHGDPGNGKTCLASAGFLRRVEGRSAGLPIEYNALMSALLALVRDNDGEPDRAVNAAARCRVLFLDDMGNTFTHGFETPGRQRWLFAILNYRYNNRLPTIITSNLTPDGLYHQFDMKLADRITEYAHLIEMGQPSLRFPPQ